MKNPNASNIGKRNQQKIIKIAHDFPSRFLNILNKIMRRKVMIKNIIHGDSSNKT